MSGCDALLGIENTGTLLVEVKMDCSKFSNLKHNQV